MEDAGSPTLRGQLVGISSFGLDCGVGSPGVYTRVSEYLTWIKKYTDELSTPDDKVF